MGKTHGLLKDWEEQKASREAILVNGRKKKILPIYRVEQFESFQMKHPRYPLECFWTACKYYMGKTWNSHEFQTGMHSWIMENQSRNTHIKI